MKYLLIGILVLNYFSFFWSVIKVFRKNEEQNLILYRVLQITSLSFWIYSIYVVLEKVETSDFEIMALLAIQVFCLIAFWQNSKIVKRNSFAIIYSKGEPLKLVEEGFYKRVRHPFYMIYLLCYLSVGIWSLNPILIGLNALLLGLYYAAALSEERKFLLGKHSVEYANYRKRTHMFFPRIF